MLKKKYISLGKMTYEETTIFITFSILVVLVGWTGLGMSRSITYVLVVHSEVDGRSSRLGRHIRRQVSWANGTNL
jgi:hypothetical protein